MRMFFKCAISALAVSAMMVLALLSSGCNKDPENPSSDSIIGTWQIEFYEEEFGGDCLAEYSFKKDGEAAFRLFAGEDEPFIIPMMWYTEGNRLYIIQEEDLSYDEDPEWDEVVYKVNGTTLEFIYYGEVTEFTKK